MRSAQTLVVGAGPGGYVCAIKLAQLGRKVLVVDRGNPGGVCLNEGCIPSKALIGASTLAAKARGAGAMGIDAGPLSVDWPRTIRWKNAIVAGLSRGVAGLLRANGIELLQGRLRFTGPREAAVDTPSGPEPLSFESAVIAAGSRAVSPPGFEFDGRLILSAKDALDLESAPQSLAVIGGGVIGLELGTVFAKLGAKVFVVEALDQLLPGVEPELSGVVARSLRRLGVEVFLRSKALGWAEKGSEVELSVGTPEGERTLRVGRVLSCVGRRPESDSLGLEAAGVAVGDGGFIRVDEGFRTSAPGIFAAGDVVSPPFLAHKASREGTLAAMSLCGAAPLPAPGFIPSAVYTDPELASVGESEAQARARGAEVLVGRFPFSACGRAHTLRETEGFVKLVADARGGRLLGASIAGPDASDLIGEAALALKLGATLSDIAGTVHPHPTLCEALAEAAEAALGHPVNIPPARR